MPPQNLQGSQVNFSPPPPAYYPSVPSKKRFPIWLKIAVVVVIVFVVVIVSIALKPNPEIKAAQKISDQFVNDLQTGDTSAAYDLTTKSYQQGENKDLFDRLVKAASSTLKGEETVSGHAVKKSTGVFVYDVKTSKGTQYIKVRLEKSGEAWQVSNLWSDNKPLDTNVE